MQHYLIIITREKQITFAHISLWKMQHCLYVSFFVRVLRRTNTVKVIWRLSCFTGGGRPQVHLFALFETHIIVLIHMLLTLNLLTFLNGIIHLPSIFGTVNYYFRDVKMKTWSWLTNSIEPGQTARDCMLAWLYSGTFGSSRIRVKHVFWKTEINIYLCPRTHFDK